MAHNTEVTKGLTGKNVQNTLKNITPYTPLLCDTISICRWNHVLEGFTTLKQKLLQHKKTQPPWPMVEGDGSRNPKTSEGCQGTDPWLTK